MPPKWKLAVLQVPTYYTKSMNKHHMTLTMNTHIASTMCLCVSMPEFIFVYYIALNNMLDDISRSTDEALNRQKTMEEPGEDRERRPSGHKRSRSDGSKTVHAITLTTGSAEEQQKGSMTTVPQQMKREKILSPPYIARTHKGDIYIYCTYLCVQSRSQNNY